MIDWEQWSNDSDCLVRRQVWWHSTAPAPPLFWVQTPKLFQAWLEGRLMVPKLPGPDGTSAVGVSVCLAR